MNLLVIKGLTSIAKYTFQKEIDEPKSKKIKTVKSSEPSNNGKCKKNNRNDEQKNERCQPHHVTAMENSNCETQFQAMATSVINKSNDEPDDGKVKV